MRHRQPSLPCFPWPSTLPTMDFGKDPSTQRRYWRAMGVATTFASEVAGGLILGWGVDWLLGVKMRWIVVGGIVGLIVGLVNFIRGALRESRAAAEEVRRRQDS